jgi:hypothetical protein
MKEDNIYKVLLELKENQGQTNAKLDDIKESIVEQSIKHDKLQDSHLELKESHNSLKGKVLWVSGTIGSIFGAGFAWLKLEWNKFFS